ncbi:hypothetical protein QT381_09240 [Galbitalea sp. SE-J8]|uniref:hypothetical protein n=1 Tax=Galbitalea sp. SE-J8 TaxID=3054952 RepID=UPI00259C9A23|nr:hypothetical protein [Galbitalea sp. SE-J8]MDM4763192.1 hypothetical protein [Galbitalea sp. SE-J8]
MAILQIKRLPDEVHAALAVRARAEGTTMSELAAEEAESAMRAWLEADLDRVSAASLVAEAWRMRAAVRPADGLYVALARSIDVPLITSDARLARAPIRDVTFIVVT